MDKSKSTLSGLRKKIRELNLADEVSLLAAILEDYPLSGAQRESVSQRAETLVRDIRNHANPGLMETFLEEYGLSTEEGISLMCLAEALLRVPDAETIDALIEDKIAPSDWASHLGQSSSPLVNASTWALLLTGKVLKDEDSGMLSTLRAAVKRLGEPVIRTAVAQAMREMGHQFVLGRDIEEAMERAGKMERRGYTYSYDMLGEAARTERDARRYLLAYSQAISELSGACKSDDIRQNPGISIKLSALHPRYEFQNRERVLKELVPRCRSLALLARSANMGLNIDAEEADRLDISLDVIEQVLSEPELAGWDGFGIVVQAYGKRAAATIDWLYALAKKLDRRLMVRLVKGAYWDTEIKRAQTLGLDGFPLFTRKPTTDLSYIANAARLLNMTDRIYPQFATHNAHTVASILELADDQSAFEFQRLHGMGESLHDLVLKHERTNCRIYAPVGAHRDLLAYLVRRLLENGANSSFVNQIVNEEIPPSEVAADPWQEAQAYLTHAANPGISAPQDLYAPNRVNSTGWDINDPVDMNWIEKARAPFRQHRWSARTILAGKEAGSEAREVRSPADPNDLVGVVIEASERDVETALEQAQLWSASAKERAHVLRKAADLYEANAGELFAIACREAGKTILDCINELREAVDFLRYYANEGERTEAQESLGIVTCISPWNFPLAIFTGQIGAALAAGNGVIAKPAETTSLMAFRAVQLLHEAGVPVASLQLLPGQGGVIGNALTATSKVNGVCFTGSTQTAQIIHRNIADHMTPDAPFVAETGGLNAMIVDSTALPEQAVRDIIASSFQSAGQRCSALRVLYLQEDIFEPVMKMLKGAADELCVGHPWAWPTDVGPVIDASARDRIVQHIDQAEKEGRLIHRIKIPENGTFVAPSIIELASISDLKEEIFGPALHVVKFDAEDLDQVISDINQTGYGLTFGLHTRIDDRVQHVVERVKAGNLYINRNQIGAIVGSQPFGGEGLSGTGPKAGGPHYVTHFKKRMTVESPTSPTDIRSIFEDLESLQSKINEARETFHEVELNTTELPGPTGESNRLSTYPRGVVLCLGPGDALIKRQQEEAMNFHCVPVTLPGSVDLGPFPMVASKLLEELEGLDLVCFWGEQSEARTYRQALSRRSGKIITLVTGPEQKNAYVTERHVCVDTTASGGNAALLAAQS